MILQMYDLNPFKVMNIECAQNDSPLFTISLIGGIYSVSAFA